eukprot:CAMPEP_0118880414 /NCGR_PEP_ID=MMETSP1163-20130328/20000_1 /TAXON_ID=124430 /ORGANISM="Phaeomonas parva, Strain CCMP2877" /LENGTH=141 /DNA_ID=CAMNT_0006816817 /DNA_START=867 /DNA_END=1292 /DNA_ORIENTATION=-
MRAASWPQLRNRASAWSWPPLGREHVRTACFLRAEAGATPAQGHRSAAARTHARFQVPGSYASRGGEHVLAVGTLRAPPPHALSSAASHGSQNPLSSEGTRLESWKGKKRAQQKSAARQSAASRRGPDAPLASPVLAFLLP